MGKGGSSVEYHPKFHSLQLSSYCVLQRVTLLKITKKGDNLESNEKYEFLWFRKIKLQEKQKHSAFPPFSPDSLVLRMLVFRF